MAWSRRWPPPGAAAASANRPPPRRRWRCSYRTARRSCYAWRGGIAAPNWCCWRTGGARWPEPIGRLGATDAAPAVRLAAIRALGASRRREVLPLLAQALQRPAADEQLASTEAP